MLLEDKVVIVSGIGPGLGQELAYGAAREGAKISIAARSTELLYKLKEEIGEILQKLNYKIYLIDDKNKIINYSPSIKYSTYWKTQYLRLFKVHIQLASVS